MKNKNKQTKFPVARIKKIMQKDEEVGKVAQATPVVISKALELFLGLIIEESSKITTERGAKRVEAYHLKHAVENTEMLDFLKELVQDIPDPSAGGTVDLDAENAEGKKKRGKGKRTAAAPAAAADPDTPAPPKRRRKKKADAAKQAADDDDAPSASRMKVDSKEEQQQQHEEEADEDTEMQDEQPEDEYDEDDTQPPPKTASTSYRPRSPSDDEDWNDNKPFMPPRRK